MIKIELFGSGSTMALEDGSQLPEAQEPWLMVFADYLKAQDIDPTQCHITLPNGRQARVFEIDDMDGGTLYNWEIVRP